MEWCHLLGTEFDRLLKKHATETGLPVVVDFYSDSCGPCRMMAPIFKKVAQSFMDQAVFVKVDTNAQYELSGRYQIRSLPTFQWFLHGKKWNEAKGELTIGKREGCHGGMTSKRAISVRFYDKGTARPVDFAENGKSAVVYDGSAVTLRKP